MNNPKISVIIPVYNAEQYIRRCIKSVLNQTLKDIQIICVDDGSTDGSWPVLKHFARQDDRIITIQQENSGVYAARNTAMQYADGKYVGFIDSDDWVGRRYYEELYKAAEKYDVDAVRAYIRTVPDKEGDKGPSLGVSHSEYEDFYNITQKQLIYENKQNIKGSLCLAIYRRKCIDEHNLTFPEKIRVGSDNLFNVQVGYYARRIKYVDKPVYYYRTVRNDSLMTSKSYDVNGVIDRINLLNKMITFINSKKDFSREVYIRIVADDITFIVSRLQKGGRINKKAISKIAREATDVWKSVIFKEEIGERLIGVDQELLSALSDYRRMQKYIARRRGWSIFRTVRLKG